MLFYEIISITIIKIEMVEKQQERSVAILK